MVDPVDKIWLDGALIPWDEAQVHVLTHSLHYGLAVFEGIRCYRRDDGRSAVFRLPEHIERLLLSARVADMPLRWSQAEVEQACLQTVRENQLDACYIRPLVFLGDGAMGLYGRDNPVRLLVAAWRWGTYLGDEGLQHGIRAKVSSFTRPGVNTSMTKAKISGNYVNSILAKREVLAAGYDEAILLDPQGYVSEASGENIFVVRHGQVVTPSLGASILGGLTRDAMLTLCRERDIPVVERPITRDELYMADEVFLTGTAAEVTPVREVDERVVGAGTRGPITTQLQADFFEIVRGPGDRHPEWLSFL